MWYTPWHHSFSQLDKISCTRKGTACQEHQCVLDECLPFTVPYKTSYGRLERLQPMISSLGQSCSANHPQCSLIPMFAFTKFKKTPACQYSILADTLMCSKHVGWNEAVVWVHAPVWLLMWARRWLHHHNAYHSSSIHPASQSAKPCFLLLHPGTADGRKKRLESNPNILSLPMERGKKKTTTTGNKKRASPLVVFHTKVSKLPFWVRFYS